MYNSVFLEMIQLVYFILFLELLCHKRCLRVMSQMF